MSSEIPEAGSFIEFLDDGEATATVVPEGGVDVIEVMVEAEATAVEVETADFIEFDDGRGPQGPPGASIYVTSDWASDPNNPLNGGALAAGILVVEQTT